MNRTQMIGEHHREQFGDVEISWITTKLGEESGELQAAVLKHVLHGESSNAIRQEIGDVLTVLAVIADRFGWDMDQLARESSISFCNRTWKTNAQ